MRFLNQSLRTLLPLTLAFAIHGQAGDDVRFRMPQAPPLPAPEGAILRVHDADELLAAVDRLEGNGSILLNDGHYAVPRVVRLDGKNNISIRSASGDPDKVVLKGRGWNGEGRGGDILQIARCQGVTIADLTFADCRSYGIKVEAP